MKRLPTFPRWLLSLAALLLVSSGAFAQPAPLERRVSVVSRDQPVVRVLDDLQSRYGIPFVYFGSPAALEQKVTVTFHNQPLRTVLDSLLARTPLTYRLVGEQIVLKPAATPTVTIAGTITDRITGEPLAFAAVRLIRAAAGTVANEAGKFRFHVPSQHETDTLVISRLGYHNYAAPVAHLLKSGQTHFALSPDTLLLAAVTVAAAPLTAAQLVDSAVANIERNYPSAPYNLNLFYRETLREGGAYVLLAEAAALLYDDRGYREPRGRFGNEKVKIMEARGIRYQPATGPNKWVNHLSATLEHNAVKYRESYLKNRRHAQYSRLPDEAWNGKPVYVVTAANPRYKVTIWIGTERYAIARYELESQPTDSFISTSNRRDSDSTFFAATYNRIVNEFREYRGKWYPQYLQWSYTFRRYDRKTGRPLEGSEGQRRLDLVVNQVVTDSVRAIHRSEEMDGRAPVGFQDGNYNAQFWQTYNQLLPLDEQIGRDLEQKGSLHGQFSQPPPPDTRKKRRKPNRKPLSDASQLPVHRLAAPGEKPALRGHSTAGPGPVSDHQPAPAALRRRRMGV
jgi:hypothetical protein